MNKTLLFRRVTWLILLGGLLARQSLLADSTPQPPTRVACVGDSITFGAGLSKRHLESYPACLGRWLGTNWDVRNFGVSGATLLSKGDRPYIKQKAYAQALEFKPDILVIMLGTNDSKHPGGGKTNNIPDNWQYKADYVPDYEALIAQFRNANHAVKVYVCYPTPCFPGFWGINDETIHYEIIPLIHRVATDTHATIIDLYDAMAQQKNLFPDTVHPNSAGARMMAGDIYIALNGKDPPPTP